MVLRHVVLGKFTDEATTEQKNEMFENLRSLPAKIPEVLSLTVGEDLGLSQGNHGLALNVEFNNADDYRVYATHPDHVGCHQQHQANSAARFRTAVQFMLGAHPAR